jgi:murein DD-endopeptidase MepM/ murein hydrolase activator NlpD
VTDIWRWGSHDLSDEPAGAARTERPPRVIRRHGGKSAALAAAIGLTASGFLAVGYVRYERLAAAQDAATRYAESANAQLQDAVARLRDQLGAANQTLTATQSRIAALNDEAHRQIAVSEESATSKADRVTQLTRAFDQAQRELHLAEAQRVTLMARLSKSETDLAVRQQQVQAGQDEWQKKVQQLTADRDRAASERDQLRARIALLEQKLSLRSLQQPPRPLAAAQPAPPAAPPRAPAPAVAAALANPPPALGAPASPPAVAQAAASPTAPAAAPPPAVAAAAPQAAAPLVVAPTAVAAVAPRAVAPAAVVAVSRGGMAQFERVLASAGVDVAHLFSQFGVRTGEGGPFIPAPRGGSADSSLTPEKLAALSRLVKALPVSAPLQGYEVGSPFGERGDPMNGREAFHTGIDLLAPYMTPVYATAPGVVTFAGYRDDYGKIVEIDHGHGIATRYAHLNRFVVSVGQQVAPRQQIGFLGSTGRATGPHVHYEVVVNGEPQDPAKFMGLARLLPAVALR